MSTIEREPTCTDRDGAAGCGHPLGYCDGSAYPCEAKAERQRRGVLNVGRWTAERRTEYEAELVRRRGASQ